jgi:hypothetical protein
MRRDGGRERVLARKRKQDEEEAARRQEEKAVMSGLRLELQALRGSDSWYDSPHRRGIRHR